MGRDPRRPQMHRLPSHHSFSFLFALLSAPLVAQPVSVWLTTDDQKTLLQPQPGVAFAAGLSVSSLTLLIDDRATHQSYTIPAARQLQASSYNNVSNLQSESCGDADGGFDLGYASAGS
jgi:hypothetical protein